MPPCIDNSHLYNEDCLLGDPERIIITEGVTDCLALMERGFPRGLAGDGTDPWGGLGTAAAAITPS